MTRTWYEIHLSGDGHVAGHGDREVAESLADEIEENTPGQTAEIIETEECDA